MKNTFSGTTEHISNLFFFIRIKLKIGWNSYYDGVMIF